ncbi:MAG: hypothetical protein PHY02_08320 [Phycisphaerae bacterium]|nr:hypothetical protein [Phycisphaerae bacterium]
MITQEIIKQFCDQCYTTRALYKEYSYLYEDNKERLDLLNKTARDFFLNFQGILKNHILLDICKITDSATLGKNSNLTIKYILKEIKQEDKNNLGLDELSDKIHKFRKCIVDARHKIIVHFDFETIKYNKTLGGFSKNDNEEFWENLQEFVNKIHIHYFNSPFILDKITDCTYNAKDLILALKKAAYFDQHFKNIIHSDLLEEEGFEYRNA